MRLNKLVRIPCYWGDNLPLLSQTKLELSELEIQKSGLKIYNFHPIHIYMNTNSLEHYHSYKKFYHQVDMLRKYKNTGSGIGTLFRGLLQHLSENKTSTYTCEDVYQEYLAEEMLL